MKITPRQNFSGGLVNYEIIEDELKEKRNIFKSMLNFVKPNRTVENSYILNPNQKKFFKSASDLNRVFVLTDTTIQRIDFSIANFKVTYEITPATPITNILLDNLKSFLKTTLNFTTKNYSIEAADIYYEPTVKTNKIYCILRLIVENKSYFYFYSFNMNNYNEISQIFINIIETADPTTVYRYGLFVNS